MRKVADETLFKLIHDFLVVYLPSQRNSSPNTIRAYRGSLEMLLDFVKQQNKIPLYKISFRMLNEKTVSAFLDSLETERGCGISTRNHRLKCIRAFLKYAAMTEPTTIVFQTELFKIPVKKDSERGQVEYMSEAAVRALLSEPDADSKMGLRNRFFMILAYDTAARIQELVDLRLRDIRLGKTPTIVVTGKGSKTRTIPLMKPTVLHLDHYLNAFHSGENLLSERPLFYSIRGGVPKALSCDSIRKWMKKCGTAAREKCREIPEIVHPHLFRHSRAMHLYQNGMDLTLISQWLGHAQLETSLIYAHADTEQKRTAIEKATPQSSLLHEHPQSRFDVNDDEVLKRLYGLR
ncbi:integrase [Clostridia bacterium]|nr:integrase [Clostridia bacterium]